MSLIIAALFSIVLFTLRFLADLSADQEERTDTESNGLEEIGEIEVFGLRMPLEEQNPWRRVSSLEQPSGEKSIIAISKDSQRIIDVFGTNDDTMNPDRLLRSSIQSLRAVTQELSQDGPQITSPEQVSFAGINARMQTLTYESLKTVVFAFEKENITYLVSFTMRGEGNPLQDDVFRNIAGSTEIH